MTTPPPVSDPPQTRKTLHILIVEDEDAVRSLLEEAFTTRGFQVHSAAEGRQALRLMEANPPDLILCDIMMPEMDGIELLLAVHKQSPDLPLIAISAPSNRLHLQIARRLGATATFEKPLKLAELTAKVEGILGS